MRENKTLTLQENKARAVVAGEKAARTPRFVKTRNGATEVDEASLARARRLVGLKGYVANIEASIMPAGEVIASYHDLWHVEQSFRMSKTDLEAKPMFHHAREAIEAHLTVVFTALAVARHLQNSTGLSIKKIVQPCGPSSRSPSASPATSTLQPTHSHRPPARSSRRSRSVLSDTPRWHESGQTGTLTLMPAAVAA